MPEHAREKFATQVDEDLLCEVRALARSEGRQIQALVDEALADLLRKRRRAQPRAQVMAEDETSREPFGSLYEYLAASRRATGQLNLAESPLFGMWRDRQETESVNEYVDQLRESRH